MIEIEKEKLQKLLDYFYKSAGICDELDIYEYEELDESLQEMKSWVQENFGRKIKSIIHIQGVPKTPNDFKKEQID